MTEATRQPLRDTVSAEPAVTASSPPAAPRRMMREPSPLARRLSYAGLIPFVAGAALLWIVRPDVHEFVALALAGYAATIVSFLGGIHWGLALRQVQPDPSLLIWGVVPSLVAWVAVVMPPSAGLVVLGAMVVGCYLRDRAVYPREGAAGWLTLRFRLTLVAGFSCFLGAAGV